MKYRLKELREDHDMKQQVLADLLCMTRQNYSRIEQEDVILSFDDAIKIANFYKISLEELLSKRPDTLLITKEEMKLLKEASNLINEIDQRMKR